MLLHLFDDEKVVNRTIDSFERVFPNKNLYICFINKSPKFVKPCSNLFFYSSDDSFDLDLLKTINHVIVHYLNYPKIEFVNRFISRSIPCTWMVWGGDLYNSILVNKGCPIYYEPWFLGKAYIKILYNNLKFMLNLRNSDDKVLLDFIKNRVTYFSTGSDYDIMRKYIGEYMNGDQVTGFSYYPIDVILGDLKNSKVKGNTIWVGNSGSFTNNHSYAFKYLSKLNIGNRIILTPLGYGGSLKYRNYVEKKGKRLWGVSYRALNNFIPLDEYNKLMTSAEICVFSSWRQEAFGNIVVALYLGAKVFLSEKSSLVAYFIQKGVKIFILERISQIDIDSPLSHEVKESNKRILYDMLNEQRILNSIKLIWGSKVTNE